MSFMCSVARNISKKHTYIETESTKSKNLNKWTISSKRGGAAQKNIDNSQKMSTISGQIFEKKGSSAKIPHDIGHLIPMSVFEYQSRRVEYLLQLVDEKYAPCRDKPNNKADRVQFA